MESRFGVREGSTMSHTYVEVHAIPSPAVPRGALLVDLVVSGLRLLFASLRSRPASRAEQTLAVRELALQVQNTDPGFASDLLAAAARHESLDDERPLR